MRPHGRRGEVAAEILTDFPESFASRKRLFLEPPAGTSQGQMREAVLEAHWLHKGRVVLKFAGIDSISAAEALIGSFVAIPLTERAPLAAGEIYIGDLIGCTLVDVAGSAPVSVGTVADVDRTAGPTPLLVVHDSSAPSGGSGEILVPFARSFLRKVDLAAKRIEMALPEGLIGLNAR